MGKAGQKNVTKKKVSQVGSKEALMREAEEALSMFDYERACMKMESALQLAPTDTDIMDKLGEVAVSYLGEEEKGLAVLRRSIEVAPDSGYTKYMTVGQAIGGGEGLQYYKKGAENLAAMMQVCTDATELADLKDSMAQCFCAVAELWTTDLCMEEGAEHQCKAALDFAAQHNPKNVELHYLYAQLNLRLDKIDESKASLQQCTALLDALDEEQHPSTDIKVEIGKLLMQVNEWSEAYQFLKLLLLEDDGNGYLWYLMGETLKHMGNFRRSLRHLLKAKSIAERIAASSPADDGDEDGPRAFLASIDANVAEVATRVSQEEQQRIRAQGEGGMETDSDDEGYVAEAKQGEALLRQDLANVNPGV